MSTKKRRPTIGEDPLDAILTPSNPEPSAPPVKSPRPPRVPKEKPVPKVEPTPQPTAIPEVTHAGGKLLKVTYNVQEELVEETRNAVLALSGPPLRLTLSALVENALRRELARLRKEHNGGKPFEGPGTALRGGRPIR
ncbi:MAG: hypothetical protein BWY86_00475 [Candidatus Aminicenantes bacterium ADurb.Bin508]|nr:MAG: hypothetical protein BWY86_00475 [Candidatus Aminicenantes bacterium ADurb.Bin508]